MTRPYSAHEIRNSEVIAAFYAAFGHKAGFAKAGRTVSGLLKAAAKAGKVRKTAHHGRVTGSSVWYHLTDEQVAEIRREAIERAVTGQPLRAKLCTPVSIEQAGKLAGRSS